MNSLSRFAIVIILAFSSGIVACGAEVSEKSFDPVAFPTLQKCIDAASEWGTAEKGVGVVSLAGKVYNVDKTLELGSHVRLQGTLKGVRSTLHFRGPACASDKEVSSVLHVNANKSGVTISHIDFTRLAPGQGGGGFGGIYKSDVAVAVQNPVSNVKLLHCKVTDYTALFQSTNMAKWSQDIEIGHCEAVDNRAYFVHIIMTRGLKFYDNTIEQIKVGEKWIHAGCMFRGVQDSEFTNNKLNTQGGGRAFNGFLFESIPAIPALGGTSGASNVNLIIRGNDIRRTKEEGILIERSREAEESCVGDVVSATATTLTRTPDKGYGTKGVKTWAKDFWQDRTVVIVNGSGLGQVRQVVSNTASTLTVDRAWDKIPDATSVFTVMHHTDGVLIENNTITDTGKASIAPYMCCGTTIRNNKMSLCKNHEWDTATLSMMCPNVNGQFGDNDGVHWPNYNNVIEKNTIDQQRSMVGIRVGNTNFSSQLPQFRTGISTYNIRIENNTVDMKGATNGPNGIVDGKSSFSGSVGIVVESAYLEEIRNVTVRGNTVTNAKFGLWIGSQFETHESPNLGRVMAVQALKNSFANCQESIHVTKGVTYDDALAIPNSALGATATASSSYDRNNLPQYACDGSIANSGWSPKAALGETPWLQLDLGAELSLKRIEVVLRQDIDQPATRKNFHVLGSNTPDFKSPVILGTQGNETLKHQATWSVDLNGQASYRYLRISKTIPEYFYIAEVRAFTGGKK